MVARYLLSSVADIHSAGIGISCKFLKTHFYTIYTYLVRLNYLTIQYRIQHKYLHIQKISSPPHPLRNRIKKVEVNAKLYEPLQLTPDKIRQKIK